jgi:hypothetical protein
MLIGFSDDTELYSIGKHQTPDIFVYGGYFIPHENLDSFQKKIAEVKFSNSLLWHAPVKWNLRDRSLVKFYKQTNFLSENSYDHLLANADKIRLELLLLLVEFDAKIIVSARYDQNIKKLPQSELFGWAFENFNQRAGLMAQAMNTSSHTSSNVILVSDWPRQGVDKTLMDTYIGGYHYGTGINTGQSYFSGALKELRFSDSLFHGSTLHSGPLQIADLVVGVSREFLNWALKGYKAKIAQQFFLPIVSQFYCNPQNNEINGYGFKLAKNRIHLDHKIKELKALQ